MQGNGRSGQPIRVIQFTDTHFFGSAEGRVMGVDTAQTLQEVLELAEIQRGVPDLYLLTGDLSQDETPESYRRLAGVLGKLRAPAYYLPGNHDTRTLMQEVFDNRPPFRADKSFVAGAWQFVLLDTQIPNEVGGHLSDEELQRLDDELSKRSAEHAFIALHHHPLPVNSAWIDTIKVDNGDALLKIVDKHPQVRAVLCGHIHQEFEQARNGVLYMGTPSTCVQFAPKSDGFAVDAVPPGYRWLELDEEGSIQSKVQRAASVAKGLDRASAGY